MSNASKIGIAIVIIIILLIIGWFALGGPASVSNQASSTPETTQTPAQNTNNTTSVSPAERAIAGTGLTNPTDTSTQSVQTDLEAIDSQMTGLNTDNTNIDSGLSTGNTIPVQK